MLRERAFQNAFEVETIVVFVVLGTDVETGSTRLTRAGKLTVRAFRA
jgi:hypothetical protein